MASFTWEGDFEAAVIWYPVAVAELRSMARLGLHVKSMTPAGGVLITIQATPPHVYIRAGNIIAWFISSTGNLSYTKEQFKFGHNEDGIFSDKNWQGTKGNPDIKAGNIDWANGKQVITWWGPYSRYFGAIPLNLPTVPSLYFYKQKFNGYDETNYSETGSEMYGYDDIFSHVYYKGGVEHVGPILDNPAPSDQMAILGLGINNDVLFCVSYDRLNRDSIRLHYLEGSTWEEINTQGLLTYTNPDRLIHNSTCPTFFSPDGSKFIVTISYSILTKPSEILREFFEYSILKNEQTGLFEVSLISQENNEGTRTIDTSSVGSVSYDPTGNNIIASSGTHTHQINYSTCICKDYSHSGNLDSIYFVYEFSSVAVRECGVPDLTVIDINDSISSSFYKNNELITSFNTTSSYHHTMNIADNKSVLYETGNICSFDVRNDIFIFMKNTSTFNYISNTTNTPSSSTYSYGIIHKDSILKTLYSTEETYTFTHKILTGRILNHCPLQQPDSSTEISNSFLPFEYSSQEEYKYNKENSGVKRINSFMATSSKPIDDLGNYSSLTSIYITCRRATLDSKYVIPYSTSYNSIDNTNVANSVSHSSFLIKDSVVISNNLVQDVTSFTDILTTRNMLTEENILSNDNKVSTYPHNLGIRII